MPFWYHVLNYAFRPASHRFNMRSLLYTRFTITDPNDFIFPIVFCIWIHLWPLQHLGAYYNPSSSPNPNSNPLVTLCLTLMQHRPDPNRTLSQCDPQGSHMPTVLIVQTGIFAAGAALLTINLLEYDWSVSWRRTFFNFLMNVGTISVGVYTLEWTHRRCACANENFIFSHKMRCTICMHSEGLCCRYTLYFVSSTTPDTQFTPDAFVADGNNNVPIHIACECCYRDLQTQHCANTGYVAVWYENFIKVVSKAQVQFYFPFPLTSFVELWLPPFCRLL